MKRFVILVSLFGIIFVHSFINAEVQVEINCSQNTIHVGDSFDFQIKIISDKKIIIDFNSIDQYMKQFHKRKFKSNEYQQESQWIYEFNYELSLFDIGKQAIGPFMIQYTLDAKPKGIQVPKTELMVQSLLDLTSTQLSMKNYPDPMQFGLDFRTRFIIIFVAIILFIGLVLMIQYIQRKKQSKTNFKQLDLISIEEKVLGKIQSLKLSRYLQDGYFQKYYDEVSLILRLYVSKNYQFSALDFTTNEIIRYLRDLAAETEDQLIIDNILKQCDLVKFAKLMPDIQLSEEILNRLEQWIRQKTVNQKDIAHDV